MPSFKVDENLPQDVVSLLQESGYDAMSVYDQKLVGQPDPRISEVCKAEGRTLITLDLDFANVRTYPPAEHPGIIVLRVEEHSKRAVLALVSSLLPALVSEALAGKLWIVESDRIRIWKAGP